MAGSRWIESVGVVLVADPLAFLGLLLGPLECLALLQLLLLRFPRFWGSQGANSQARGISPLAATLQVKHASLLVPIEYDLGDLGLRA